MGMHPGPGTGYQLYLSLTGGPVEYTGRPIPYNCLWHREFGAGVEPARSVRIINRYVLKEHAGPLIFAMSALTSLLLLNYIAKQLPQLVGKGLPWTVIAEFLVLALPFTVAMTLPMAVLVATLHAFSRMAADSEITAFKASGLALPKLMLPVVTAGLALSLVMVWFNDQVMPAANYALQTLMNDIARKKPTFALRPQVINEVSPGRFFLRAGHLAGGSSDLRDVTIYDLSDATERRTIRADSGEVHLSPDGLDLLLTLYHGDVVSLSRTEPGRLQRVFFETNFIRVRGVANDLERNQSAVAEKSDRERTVCELQGQLRQALNTRDSVRKALVLLDSAAAGAFPARVNRTSTGALYCRVVNYFRARTLEAATLPGAPVADVAATQGAAPPAASATDTQGAAPPAASATDTTAAASLGVTQSKPPENPETPVPILIEGMKAQLAASQALIYGDQVEIEKKFAIATACVIFALLGAPIAFRFPRAGVGLTIGVSLLVFGVYYCGLIAGEELARRGLLPAYVAMWGTNAMLLIVGAVLTARLGSEGTTHRSSGMSDRLAHLMDRLRRRGAPRSHRAA